MSIKGISKELFIGKSELNILNSKRKKYTLSYNELDTIKYWLAADEYGKLIFITKRNQQSDFSFDDTVNDAVLRAIDYIKDKCPKITIELLNKEQRPEFQTTEKSHAKIKHQKCKNCGKEYDSDTDICPYCNYSNTDTHFKWLLIGGIIVFILSAILYISQFLIIRKSTADAIDKINNITQNIVPESKHLETLVAESSAGEEAFTTTLTAGHYLVGTDIPVGTYSFFSKKGSGNLYSSDGTINVIFDHGNEAGKNIGIEDFGTEELKNIYLENEVILSVTGTQQISAGCDDGLVQSMTSRDQDDLKELEVGYGNYGASDNIPAGTYDIEWLEGKGNIICSSSTDLGINEIMGDASKEDELGQMMYIKNFRNLTINEGDILEIDQIKIKLIPSK